MKIEFENGSIIESMQCKNNIRSKRAEYFNKINEYIDNLPDKEFDDLLIECGIEKCQYDDNSEARIQNVLVLFKEGKVALEKTELMIKELFINKINNCHTVYWAFDKNESFLAGMEECAKIIKNL